MKPRLARLERQVRQFTATSGGTCMTCRGSPWAVLLKDRANEGPRLQPGDDARLTRDLHCRGCGRPARQVLLVTALSASLADDRTAGIATESAVSCAGSLP